MVKLISDEMLSILVIDDDQVDRRTVKRLLGSAYHCVEAENDKQALDCLDSEQVDCVLLDYRISGVDTMLLLQTLAKRGLPVVMLTGEGNEETAVNAMKHGAKDYLVKGWLSVEALERAIANAIERSQLEKRVSEQQRELEDFAHIASHDLNAPLNKISLSCQFALDQLEGSEHTDLTKIMNVAIRGCDEMSRLIRELLEYSRVGRSEKPLEVVSLTEVFEQATWNLEAAMTEAGAEVTWEDAPTVPGDRTALVQFFQNLISNSIKYRSDRKPVVKISCEAHGDKWQIALCDNGMGIAPEDQEKIFGAFQRLKNAGSAAGYGIGLAFCKRVIEQHRGEMRLESELGKGTTFFVTLHAAEPDQECEAIESENQATA